MLDVYRVCYFTIYLISISNQMETVHHAYVVDRYCENITQSHLVTSSTGPETLVDRYERTGIWSTFSVISEHVLPVFCLFVHSPVHMMITLS